MSEIFWMDSLPPTPLLIGAQTRLDIETLVPIIKPDIVAIRAAFPKPNVRAPDGRGQARLTGAQSPTVAMALNNERCQSGSTLDEIDFRCGWASPLTVVKRQCANQRARIVKDRHRPARQQAM